MRPKIPVSLVIPTKDRRASLARTLESLLAQSHVPTEVIIVDSSSDDETEILIQNYANKSLSALKWVRADRSGAAVQRNQGVEMAVEPFICFCDDDVLFEPECMKRLWQAMDSNARLGGANVTIVNQKYHPPGMVSRTMFSLLHGRREKSFAGRVIGPAVNLLPEDREDLPEVVPVEWLNLGCTLYRRQALPTPPFDSVFTGYSLMEDLTLSLRVAKNWSLANVRTARIFHDSQPGMHKSNISELARMELVNRHYVMTSILGRNHLMDYFRLFLWEIFQILVSSCRRSTRPTLIRVLRGKWQALSLHKVSSGKYI